MPSSSGGILCNTARLTTKSFLLSKQVSSVGFFQIIIQVELLWTVVLQTATGTWSYSRVKNDKDEDACFGVKLVVGRALYTKDVKICT